MISVVVPTYNEEKNICKLLETLNSQTLPRSKYEIIVVDGGSTDRTRDLASKLADRVVLQKSKGIGGARNDGVAAAKHGIVATTDADVSPPENWLETILEKFADDRVIAVCGADDPIELNWKSRATFLFLKNFVWLASKFGFYTLGGTNSAFRKNVFLSIGGYKPLSHSDDVELGFRMRKMGKIAYDRKISVKISTRRLEKNGYLRTLSTWAKGDARLFLGLPIKDVRYAKESY